MTENNATDTTINVTSAQHVNIDARNILFGDSTTGDQFITLNSAKMVLTSDKVVFATQLLNTTSLATSGIRAAPTQPLSIAASGTLSATSLLGTTIQSSFGGIHVSAASNVTLSSQIGVVVDSSAVKIDISRLPKPSSSPAGPYTVCSCPSGSLFLMPGSLRCGLAAIATQFPTSPCH